jgi:ABC-type sugar transport system substrate-binding protein
MEDFMKRRFTVIFVLMAAALLFIACQKKTASEGASLGRTTDAFDTGWTGLLKPDMPRYRIGVCYLSFTDKLGAQMKNALEYLAEGFNIDFVFIESSGDIEARLAAVEAALQSKLDGIITVNASSSIVDACRKAGDVPLLMIQSEPATEAVAKEMAGFENYLGAVCENDYQVGERAALGLYNDGARNFCVLGVTKGLYRTHDQRADAAESFIKSKSDAKLLADDFSRLLFADAIDSFAASYPEWDGLFCTAGVESIYQALNTNGLTGKVKFATIDVSDSTGEYLESGALSWIAGGQYGTTMIGFAILYNYLADGTRIIPNTSATLYRPFLEIGSLEEYKTYVKYVDGKIPVYSVGEVGNMIHKFNSEVDFAYFENLGKVYSIDDIYARHSELLK